MKKRTFSFVPLILIAILIFIYVTAYSAPFQGVLSIPVTGQTTSYASRDDGALQIGVAWPSPRFTNTTSTIPVTGAVVLDRLTGLTWQRDASGAMDFTSEITYCEALSLGGSTDWRMPNILELESLTHAGQANGATWLNTQGFQNVGTIFYWVSTDYDVNGGGWALSLEKGRTCLRPGQACDGMPDAGGNGGEPGLGYTNVFGVLCVRGGATGTNNPAYLANVRKTGMVTKAYDYDDAWQVSNNNVGVTAWYVGRFTNANNTTPLNGNVVIDTLTGLMWTRSGNRPLSEIAPTSATSTAMVVTWTKALNFISDMNNGTTNNSGLCGSDNICQNFGYTDWRLPNKNEFYSLTHWEQEMSSDDLGTTYGFTNVANVYADWGSYWTSTTYPADTSKVFGTGINSGAHQLLPFPSNQDLSGWWPRSGSYPTWYIWPVRSVQNYTATVNCGGAGNGTVKEPAATGANISCTCTGGAASGDCTDQYQENIPTTLTASPNSGSGFTSWTSCDSPSSNTCMQTMATSSEAVTASFALTVGYTLEVSINPLSIATSTMITNNPLPTLAGNTYTPNTYVTSTATDTTGYIFSSWTNCISGNNASTTANGRGCVIQMTENKICSTSKCLTANYVALSKDMNITPSSVSFGRTSVGNTPQTVITVQNTSNDSITVSSVASPSAPFSIVSRTCTDGLTLTPSQGVSADIPNSSCTITVRFSPTAPGAQMGSFLINNNTSNSAYRIALSGIGVAGGGGTNPDISVSQTDMSDFLDTDRDAEAFKDQTLTIYNYGGGDALVISAITSTNAKFALQGGGTCGAAPITITQGSSCTQIIRYTHGLANGASTATPDRGVLRIVSNDPDEGTLTVGLIGAARDASVNPNRPTKAVPVSPANGATNVETISFYRTPATDADGDTLSEVIYLSTDPSFETYTVIGAADLNPAGSEGIAMYAGILGSPIVGIMLLGIMLAGGFILRKRGKTGLVAVFLIVAVLLTYGLLLSSCGGGGGGGGGGGSSGISSGVVSSQTYYWKVGTNDGRGGISESDTYSFRTGS